jgi:mono/diheme cytochrome c family protein
MKTVLLFLEFIFSISCIADDGKVLFQTTCAACHTIGKGRLVGPDLKNLSERRSKEWSANFIRSSQTLIKSGDPEAVAVFTEYNKMLMPDVSYNDAQIGDILVYVENESAGTSDPQPSTPVPDMLANVTQSNIDDGADLFSGKTRLSNQGPSCAACHKVKDNRIFSSGKLAKELTLTYENMGSAGVAAILKNPPFPAMKSSYSNHPLTDEEVLYLTAYLKTVSKERFYQNPRDYDLLFITSGFFVFLMILIGIEILYFKRKRQSVNENIFKRQTQVAN